MIKVSIIVPVYNVEKYLRYCLDSLVKQTLKEIEIICINDGSVDNSLSVLNEYANKDSRIQVIDKENEGQAIARNIGISKATGEFLGFVDSDDWVDLDYFEKMYNAAISKNCDMACAGFKRCRTKRQSIKKRYEAELILTNINDKVRLDNLPSDNYVWNKIYRRTSWQKAGIEFQSGRYFEDMALVIKILYLLGKMVTVPDVFYYYRVNPNSTVATKSPKHTEDYRWAEKELYDFAAINNIKLYTEKMVKRKEYIKFLNITLIKIYYYENLIKYNLFGFIPLAKKIIV